MNLIQKTKNQLEAKKVLLWLSFECPLGGNPMDCVGHRLRLRSTEERRAAIDSMSGSEWENMYELHRACLRRKELARYALSCRRFDGAMDEASSPNIS